jgi:TRAP-type C4-dicarboxylate transport system permease small subunit
MTILDKIIGMIVNVNKWISFGILILMMIFVGIAALSRGLGYPIIGDVEFVQFGMVLLIVGSLAFTEDTNSHIAIGIVVDKFPKWIQTVLDIIAQTLTIGFCFVVAYVFFIKLNFVHASTLLRIPFYPFKILLIIGFVAWALVAIKKLIYSIQSLKKSTV